MPQARRVGYDDDVASRAAHWYHVALVRKLVYEEAHWDIDMVLSTNVERDVRLLSTNVESAGPLIRLALGIAAGADRATVMHAALEAVLATTDADTAHVSLFTDGLCAYSALLGAEGTTELTSTPTALFPGGANEAVLRTRAVVVVDDVAQLPVVRPSVAARGTRSSGHVPVWVGHEIVGVLHAEWREPSGGTPERVARLAHLAAHLAIAIAHVRQHEELEVRLRQQTIVSHTAAAIASTNDLDEALRHLLIGMGQVTGATRGAVVLPVTETDGADPPLARELYWYGGERFVWAERMLWPNGFCQRALVAGEPRRYPDLAAMAASGDAAAQLAIKAGVLSCIVTPLRTGGRRIGSLHADALTRDAFSDRQIDPLQLLADHAAGAIEQTRLQAAARVRLRRLDVVARVAAAANAAGDLDQLLGRILDETLSLLSGDRQRGQIALVDADGSYVRGRVGRNLPDGLLAASVRRIFREPTPEEDIIALAVRTGEQLVVEPGHPNAHAATTDGFPVADMQVACTPIWHAAQVIGVLVVGWDQARPGAEELRVLRIVAAAVGGAIARERLAEAEREARRRLDMILRASGTVLYTTDRDGRMASLDGDVEALWGWPREVLLGQPLVTFVHPTVVGPLQAITDRHLAGSVEFRQDDSVLLHRSGRAVPVLIAAGPRLEQGQVVGTAGAITDVTILQRIEAERDAAKAAQARAEGAVRTGRAVAHALGSPITAVLGLVDLLTGDSSLSAEARADVIALGEEAARAGELLKRFGQIARYAEMPTPAGPQLDVDRASEQRMSVARLPS